jgi:DTW domain-containing protein YfiP
LSRCERCLFVDCLCGCVSPVHARTQVVIVRHHLEKHRSSNSGRLAHFALANSVLVDHGGGVTPTVLPPLDGAWLLFPTGPETLAPPSPPPRQLVVLDATWSQARRMFRKLPALRGLPILRLPEGAAQAQRLRSAPSADRVSTIEAIAAALRLLEGDTGADSLLQLFQEACSRALASGRRVADRTTLVQS